MAINSSEFSPYLSGVLFRHTETTLESLIALRAEIRRLLRENASQSSGSGEKNRRFQNVEDDAGDDEGYLWTVLQYAENRFPPWCRTGELKETHQHLVAISAVEDIVKIGFTDNAARSFIVRAIKKADDGVFGNLSPLGETQIKKSLVASSVRTLWLSGTHRQSVVKPDSKTLSGIELEAAIDPLSDQSYYYSSIRSTVTSDGLTQENRPAVIGVSPRESRFWFSPTKSWDEFKYRSSGLLRHVGRELARDGEYTDVLSMLAQPGGSLDDLQAPYDVAFVVPELQQRPDAQEDEEEKWFQDFADTVRFEVESQNGTADFKSEVHWGDVKLGVLAFGFEEKESGGVKLNISAEDWADDEQSAAIRSICCSSANLNVYFDTGHTYSRGQLYQTAFRDPRFEPWRWVNMGADKTQYGKEKPTKDTGKGFKVEAIGLDEDKSLFGLVARHWPNLEDRGEPSGWLVCDDGSMESADFIHINPDSDPVSVSLIHVKGSGSKKDNRGLSVSDYEVVVGQAVKNLRYLDSGNLHSKLEANKHTQLRDAVWKNGVRQESRDEVLMFIENMGSRIETHVYVLQPSVRKSVWEDARSKIDRGDHASSEVLRLKQLDTLLQGASADCYSLGARFSVIADDA